MRRAVFIISIFILIPSIFCTTEEMSTDYCYGDPSSPIQIEGARVRAFQDMGEKVCYFRPTDPSAYMYVRVDNLNLERMGTTCPYFKLSIYSKTITRVFGTELYVQDQFVQPDDLRLMVAADCNNYTKVIGYTFQTIDRGYKLEMKYQPHVNVAPSDAYKFTMTPYRLGESFTCPDTYFRCWSNKFMCISESLECDGVDNCFDNSDEENYKCTGKIGVLPLPLFVIIIVVAFLILVIVAANIILCLRARRRRQAKKLDMIRDMNIPQDQPYQFHDYNPDMMSEQSGEPMA